METECPLRAWLDRENLSVTDFATRSNISFHAVYQLLAGYDRRYGKRIDPHASTLVKIEQATDGAVPMRAIIEWLSSLPETQETT
jgi:predicted transcriptional regulator